MRILKTLASGGAVLWLAVLSPSQAAVTVSIPVSVTVVDSCAIGTAAKLSADPILVNGRPALQPVQDRLTVRCSAGTHYILEMTNASSTSPAQISQTKRQLVYTYTVTDGAGELVPDGAPHSYSVSAAPLSGSPAQARTYAHNSPIMTLEVTSAAGS